MWELACLRWRCVRCQIGWLAHRYRRQASSHIFDWVYNLQPSSACWLLPNVKYSTSSGNGNGLLIR